MPDSMSNAIRFSHPLTCRLLSGLCGLLVCMVLVVFVTGCPSKRAQIRSQTADALNRVHGNVADQRQVNPQLLQYRQAEMIPTGLTEPRGIALTGSTDQLAVVGDRLLVKLGIDGKRQAVIAMESEPVCVSPASSVQSGKLWVGFRRRVQLYGDDGNVMAGWDVPGPNAYITSMAAHDEGLFVADGGNRVVWHYSASGELKGEIGRTDEGDADFGLVVPSPYLEVAVAADNSLVVTNPGRRRIEFYTMDGQLKSQWGRASQDLDGFCGCCNPVHIALMPDERIVTAEKGLPRVKVYSTDGNLSSVVATPDDLSRTAAGIDLAVDDQGRVYVLDPPARAVRVFERLQSQTAGE